MKKLKQIITSVKETPDNSAELNELVWQLICYPPKMPVRLQQQQLLDEAEKFNLQVNDDYFTKSILNFNGFTWGKGHIKVLITHGWGSKAADFTDLINRLQQNDNLQIIAFDAPGFGSSEAELSNLILFSNAVEAVTGKYGSPNIVIGHSLGAMANVMALQKMNILPQLLISLTPLVRLKENFEASLAAVEVSYRAQRVFLQEFEEKFKTPADFYNLKNLYQFDGKVNHLLFYDEDDLISPYAFIKEFLELHPTVKRIPHKGVGHDRFIKDPEVINHIAEAVEMMI